MQMTNRLGVGPECGCSACREWTAAHDGWVKTEWRQQHVFNKEVTAWQSLWDSRMWKLAAAMFLAALAGSAIGNKIPLPW